MSGVIENGRGGGEGKNKSYYPKSNCDTINLCKVYYL